MQLAVLDIFIQRTLHKNNNDDDDDEHKEQSNHMGYLTEVN